MPKEKNAPHSITLDMIPAFIQYLRKEEREQNTIKKYERYAKEFVVWLKGRPVTKATVVAWKDALLRSDEYKPATVNARLASVNAFLKFLGWDECRVKSLRLQRRVFRDPGRDLSKEEYMCLVEAAQASGNERLALVMEAICAMGLRVSEVRYITVEAVALGRAEISLKGKVRTVILPGKLCRKLEKYIRKNKIASGEVFLTRSGKGLSRRQIWAEMKRLCGAAGVEPSKVFPHNLRHLFATTHYRTYKDIVKLADILGHSCVETTRIYLVSTGVEHARQMDNLGLVS